jgi:NifU-like protein
MLHAAQLLSTVLTPQAREVFFEACTRLMQEPWTQSALRLSAERRVRKAFHLPEGWRVVGLPARAEALRLVVGAVVERSQQEGLPHVCFREGLSADWYAQVALWKAQGISWRKANCLDQLSRRSSAWLLSWGHCESGELLSAPQQQACPVVLDITSAAGQIAMESRLWTECWAGVSCVVCSLEPIMGVGSPTVLFVRDQWLSIAREPHPLEGACLMGVGAALEELAPRVEGEGFESARRRAAWEDQLRQLGAHVVAEGSERMPGWSQVQLPGRSSAYLHGLLRHRQVWAADWLQEPGEAERGFLTIAATRSGWDALQKLPSDFWNALKRSEKLAEGLEAWPCRQAPKDPHRFEPKVMQRAYRPLYAGQLKAEYAMDGLRLVRSSVRAVGVEGLLSILVDEEDGVIVDAAYQAFGPPCWVALAEILCESLIRRSYRDAQRLSAQAFEEALTGEEWSLEPVAQRWLNLWLEALEACGQQCQDIECLELPMVTPMSLEGLEPGEPYPGWDQMDKLQKLAVIEAVLDADVRPYIALDAGGIAVLAFDEPVLKVGYSGSCTTCPSSMGSTLNAIQQTLKAKVHPDLLVVPDLQFATSNSSL